MLCSAGAMASGVDIAINGGAESGDFMGWDTFDNGGTVEITTDNPSGGVYAIELNGSGGPFNPVAKNANIGIGVITPGAEVTVSFDIRGSASAGGVFFAEIFSELAGGGVSQAEILGGGPLFPDADSSVWTSYSFTTTVGPDVSGGISIQFAAICGAVPGCVSNYFVDNLVVKTAAPIPVPAAVWLLGSAIGLLGLRKRAA
ncbi:MAG: carbohydrate binding domain-containing protein [Pseudomonadota bacterium]